MAATTYVGLSFILAIFAVFIIFKMRMGWKDSLMRFFSSLLAALLVYFFVYTVLNLAKSNVINVVVFYIIFALTSYIMYKAHAEAKEEEQDKVEVQRF